MVRFVVLGFLVSLWVGCADPEPESSARAWPTEETQNNRSPDPDPDPEPEPLAPAQPVDVGAACVGDDACQDGTCRDWLDGYCTISCAASCPDGSVCSGDFCAARCEADDDCRQGYMCDGVGAAASRVCVPADGAADGEACVADSDCAGGSCMTDWLDGYCTTPNCTNYQECARQGNENRCLQNPRGQNLCVRICTEDSECRDGYVCQQLSRTQGMCAPDPRQPIERDVFENGPFVVSCVRGTAGPVQFDYDIDPDTTSYMVTPFNPDNRGLRPNRIALPSGAAISLRGTNGFQSIPSQIYGGINPTVVPATPFFVDQREGGAHTYSIDSQSDETCWYVLQEKEIGAVLDLNFYFVGLDGLDAASAPTHVDLQEVISGFDAIYQSAGFAVGQVRYYDVDPEVATRFSFIRDEGSIPQLVAQSKRPGPTLDDVLSVNVFFVRGIAGSVLGISLGLPGPAGLHGMNGSGVVFTSKYLGGSTQDGFGSSVDGNVFTAEVMAHEVGHYLGLFHTTEQNGSNDPLADTPECGRISMDCPDIGNLMFPFAAANNLTVTPDQSFVIGVNPLTKPAPVETGMGEL